MSAIRFDPRTKLVLLFMCVLCTMFAPSLTYELFLVILAAVFGLLSGQYRYTFFGLIAYCLIFLATKLSIYHLTGIWQAIFIAFFGLVNKVYPCGFMAGIMIATTKTGEFMAALYKIHMPDSFVIPFAVMMRYLPVVKEDWNSITDAMKMRDVSPSLKGTIMHPVMTAECLYVPMMMAASNTADELSIASVTRGIENPNPRTCLTKINFSVKDVLAVCFILIYFIIGLLIRRGLL
ncbi:energy-coupling factor transporter transmembrane component T [Anaerocolumna xylanovorans]|uniref:Energy-coupling factor transport system permease protein n=1 Tax=Anaerocolumna xylanovorans DSM 12503 TaxID=1121345 RepID=A0A1M7YM03_9FIRM|nr:energy-coupling factor transporter transmembrane component T [Anaerocolumna xylanovorans]SHO53663.1 energy-coupling factor transport system permease protein [Anaerocolumna xylanovorans DSM 12503]